MNKIFIIGLPRTGTTSISIAMLDYGFKVAHTAYTKQAFELADVLSDSPCFCDYPELDTLFPGSKFVYLDRALADWIPSIQMLLKKMYINLEPKAGIFNPILKRSFNEAFHLYIKNNSSKQLILNEQAFNEEHLATCYRTHKSQVLEYFAHRDDLLMINMRDKESLDTLLRFLDIPHDKDAQFPHVNIGKHVSGWREYKHPNKVNALSPGKDQRKFFDYK
ncbi:MAG: sulfotransferase family protein [Oleispira antarctica]|nr:sulfotransferase family protein [Oleispira antarctica]MBQ0792900.1 sulfotransferase family protein [Oleispira antarctica]